MVFTQIGTKLDPKNIPIVKIKIDKYLLPINSIILNVRKAQKLSDHATFRILF